MLFLNSTTLIFIQQSCIFFPPALSLFPPLFLGLEPHNIVNLSLWQELCYLEILFAGSIYSEFLPFAVERKTPMISNSIGFVIDRVAFFKELKSNLNANLFFCAWKNPGACVVRMRVPLKQKFWMCTLSFWASWPRLLIDIFN